MTREFSSECCIRRLQLKEIRLEEEILLSEADLAQTIFG